MTLRDILQGGGFVFHPNLIVYEIFAKLSLKAKRQPPCSVTRLRQEQLAFQ